MKNLNFGKYSHRANQSGACSSSDFEVASGGRNLKQQWRTKSSLLYVDTRSCTIHLRTFIETGIKRILLGRKWVRRSDNLVSCKKFELYIYILRLQASCAYSPYFTTTFPLMSWCVYSEEVCRNETGAAWQKPLSWRVWSEFHARMKRISLANEVSKLKMFKRPTTREQHGLFAQVASGVNAP